jgi:hypothetical protein
LEENELVKSSLSYQQCDLGACNSSSSDLIPYL